MRLKLTAENNGQSFFASVSIMARDKLEGPWKIFITYRYQLTWWRTNLGLNFGSMIDKLLLCTLGFIINQILILNLVPSDMGFLISYLDYLIFMRLPIKK